MIYNTAEEIRAAFIADGWNESIRFSEMSKDEVEEHGISWQMARMMEEGRKFFRMDVCNNIYDDRGNVFLYHIPVNPKYRYNI